MCRFQAEVTIGVETIVRKNFDKLEKLKKVYVSHLRK